MAVGVGATVADGPTDGLAAGDSLRLAVGLGLVSATSSARSCASRAGSNPMVTTASFAAFCHVAWLDSWTPLVVSMIAPSFA